MNTPQYQRRPAGGRSQFPSRVLAIIGSAVVGLVVLVVAATALLGGFNKTAGGEVGVVRNGGWLDDNRVRQVVPAGSARTWTGLYSTMHRYPAQQRFYTITSDSAQGDRTGVDVVRTPSADGVEMGIEGTIYFTLNLDPEALKQFDTKFGTRQFRGVDGTLRYAYDGDEGWSSFLDAIVRPVIDNDLRIQISKFRCAELVSSCALVQNGVQRTGTGAPGDPAGGGQANNTNIAKVQEAVNESLPRDLAEMLGGEFFEGIKFNLARVTLPQAVQEAVNKAQAAYAAVSEAQAKVAQAKAEADANKTRQQGYDACSACAQIDIIKALPPGVTTYAPGAGTAVPLK
ncbi:SPFH domain-containing protein [Micromonospora sp. NPDC050686]|uniref:SPFH domain-containing protein n=1 Tax=Micromonospora sp. NPDC050686 TaxID=3154631 RepID=UPI0034025CF2